MSDSLPLSFWLHYLLSTKYPLFPLISLSSLTFCKLHKLLINLQVDTLVDQSSDSQEEKSLNKRRRGRMSTSSTYNSPCAACKFLRRKCMPNCIFAPYFPPEEPQKFANVHKIFGASNVTKLLNDLLPHQREDAVNSLAYEAEARVRDPVYGCVGAISFLQRQIDRLQKELDAANAELIRYACQEIHTGFPLGSAHSSSIQPITPPQRANDHYPTRRMGNTTDGGGGGFYQAPHSFAYPYADYHQWNPSSSGGNLGGGGGGKI